MRRKTVSVVVVFKNVPPEIGTARLLDYTRRAVRSWSGGIDPADPLMGAACVQDATAKIAAVRQDVGSQLVKLKDRGGVL